ADGSVLVTGGDASDGRLLKSAELYNPTTGLCTQLSHPMKIARNKHTSTLLSDGRVLVEGGKNADLYDPTTQLFTTIASKPVNRQSHAALLLPDGTVLITGGYVGKLASPTAEIY